MFLLPLSIRRSTLLAYSKPQRGDDDANNGRTKQTRKNLLKIRRKDRCRSSTQCVCSHEAYSQMKEKWKLWFVKSKVKITKNLANDFHLELRAHWPLFYSRVLEVVCSQFWHHLACVAIKCLILFFGHLNCEWILRMNEILSARCGTSMPCRNSYIHVKLLECLR